ncbi:MAG: hypothetical protein JWL62_2644 [Hyphomicrobiales bacterium]|nr:hypothetical protein [Hyphomicrobiales bacterium]
MSLSILRSERWRKLSWVAYCLAAVALIEIAIAVTHPTQEDARRNFLEYRYGHQEVPDRLLIAEKLRLFKDDAPNILQVGDSSGFHGIVPPVVEAIIPRARYLNANVFATQGYGGFYEVAKYFLERNNSVRVLVLFATPAGDQPRDATVSEKQLIGDDIQREFNSPVHRLLQLPSLGLRPTVTDYAYYGTTDAPEVLALREAERYPEARLLMPQSGGWDREHDSPGDVAENVLDWDRRVFRNSVPANKEDAVREAGAEFGVSPRVYDWRHRRWTTMADQTYDRFRLLAEEHGAKLVIAAAPVADVFNTGEVGERLAAFETHLEAYAQAHPGVGIVPLTFLPTDRFSSTVHVSAPYASAYTRQFSEALRDAIGPEGIASLPTSGGPPRPTASVIDIGEGLPGYGFGPPTKIDGETYRAIREGRSEALLFTRVAREATRISIDFGPDTPSDLLSRASVAVFGEKAVRVGDSLANGSRRITWALPVSAKRYQGWLELLLSTRGLAVWPGDQLTTGANGPRLKISRVEFH